MDGSARIWAAGIPCRPIILREVFILAQALHCDADGCKEMASVIMSNLDNGDTKAFCPVHFNVFCVEYAKELVSSAQKAAQEEKKAQEAESKGRKKAAKKAGNGKGAWGAETNPQKNPQSKPELKQEDNLKTEQEGV